LQVFGTIDVPDGAQQPIAESGTLQIAQRLRQHRSTAPRHICEYPRRNAPGTDERITAIFGRRQHHVGASLQQAACSPQIRGSKRRAVGADQDGLPVPP
jgi:hypothetical protein